MEERLAILLSRKLAGEATPEELAEFDKKIKDNPGDQFLTGILHGYWNDYSPASIINKKADLHFENILKAAQHKEVATPDTKNVLTPARSRTRFTLKFGVMAAILAGAVLLGAWFFYFSSKPGAESNALETIVAARGSKSRLLLPGGSTVWLHSTSKLVFDRRFSSKLREVTLEGEAFFEVVKDKKRPFIVHTSAIDIRVLGTSFNVKSYREDNTIETTLIHGLVEVTDKTKPTAPKIILRPSEKLVFSKEGTIDAPDPGIPARNEKAVSTGKSAATVLNLPDHISEPDRIETAWVHNRLIFEGDTFRELAAKMERWYNVRFSFENENLANYRLRGVFEDETLEQALQALQLITPFNYEIDGNVVKIRK